MASYIQLFIYLAFLGNNCRQQNTMKLLDEWLVSGSGLKG